MCAAATWMCVTATITQIKTKYFGWITYSNECNNVDGNRREQRIKHKEWRNERVNAVSDSQ